GFRIGTTRAPSPVGHALWVVRVRIRTKLYAARANVNIQSTRRVDGGSSRRSGVMRLCSSEQPAHISLIRRRSRSIVSRAPASSGNRPCRPERYSDVSIDHEIEGAVTNRLTAGPSI